MFIMHDVGKCDVGINMMNSWWNVGEFHSCRELSPW